MLVSYIYCSSSDKAELQEDRPVTPTPLAPAQKPTKSTSAPTIKADAVSKSNHSSGAKVPATIVVSPCAQACLKQAKAKPSVVYFISAIVKVFPDTNLLYYTY